MDVEKSSGYKCTAQQIILKKKTKPYPSHVNGGNIKWCSHFKKTVWQFLKKADRYMSYHMTQ